ncbi:universal stress protein [Neosynechococcus sphagnicola sy1]|uniref:Universal stress protein n=1 Tax=Neosynechococcus sphagnicola sy1 TaxID=1497020 RepID=A0A098TLE6_9CYAN|nr:universal stress protein [Neosynechococcus sphagnicola]KGF73129.1 universal stress protein [Neosynechococcus sphagnicola sy1]
MPKIILVALDCGTELADLVLQSLDTLNLQPDTQIILCHVIPVVASEGELVADRPHDPDLEQQLQTYQTDLSCPSQLEMVAGDPAEEIVRLAHIYKAELIVIGSRGLTGLKRILQGSVSSQVVADAPCSVLVVKLSEPGVVFNG